MTSLSNQTTNYNIFLKKYHILIFYIIIYYCMVQLYLECYGIQYVQYFIILVNQAKQLTLNTFQLYTFQLHVHWIFKCCFNFRAENQLLFLMVFFSPTVLSYFPQFSIHTLGTWFCNWYNYSPLICNKL